MSGSHARLKPPTEAREDDTLHTAMRQSIESAVDGVTAASDRVCRSSEAAAASAQAVARGIRSRKLSPVRLRKV